MERTHNIMDRSGTETFGLLKNGFKAFSKELSLVKVLRDKLHHVQHVNHAHILLTLFIVYGGTVDLVVIQSL